MADIQVQAEDEVQKMKQQYKQEDWVANSLTVLNLVLGVLMALSMFILKDTTDSINRLEQDFHQHEKDRSVHYDGELLQMQEKLFEEKMGSIREQLNELKTNVQEIRDVIKAKR